MKSGVYVIVCELACRVYVGSSRHVPYRLTRHKQLLGADKHGNKKMQAVYNKYGKESFTFEFIEQCIVEKLIEREQWYIDYLLGDDFAGNGMNISPTAGRTAGVIRSKEWLERLSKARIGRIPWNKGLKLGKQSTELIQKRVEGRRGYRHSVETRQKIADGNKGKSRHASAETLQKRSVSMRGKNNKSVFKYDALGLIVMWYPSLEMAAESVSGNRSKLSVAIKNGKIFKGYTWKFEKQLELDFIGKWMHDLVKGKSKILQAEIKNNNGIKRNKSAGH
jgi:group I intron endonuclease